MYLIGLATGFQLASTSTGTPIFTVSLLCNFIMHDNFKNR